MKITLTNFKCYKETTTFEFIDFGTILISGNSGKGKSTILLGINFALYNSGGRHISSYGQTKTKVEFTFKDLKIVRTRNPSRLVVNDIYEDQVGQQMINDFFGKNFDVTGYVAQNAKDSFINRGAVDKREFLESVKFEHEHLSEKKEKIENLIKEYLQKLDKTQATLETTRSFLGDEPVEVLFPLQKKKDMDRSIENENMRFKNANTEIIKIQKKIKKNEEKLNALRVANTYLNSKDENLNQICHQLENLSLEMKKNDSDYIGEKKLDVYRKKLHKLKNNSELSRLISQRDADEIKIESMRVTEVTELNNNIAKIQSELWKSYSKEDALEVIQTNEDVLKDLSQIKLLKDKKSIVRDVKALEQKKTDISNKLENFKIELQLLDVLTCPTCEAELLLQNGSLIKSTVTPLMIEKEKDASLKSKSILVKQIQSLSNDLKLVDYDILQQQDAINRNSALDIQIESILSQYEDELNESELKEDLKEMTNYHKSQLILENKLQDYQEKIKKEYFSPSYQAYKKELNKLTLRIQNLNGERDSEEEEEEGQGEGQEEEGYNEDAIRDIINDHQQKKMRIEHLQKQVYSQGEIKIKLVSQIEEYRSNFFQKYASLPDDHSESTLIEEIKEMKLKQKEFEVKYEEHKLNLQQIEEYLKFKKQEESYRQHQAKIEKLEQDEKVDSCRYTMAKIVKQGLFEAEHIALTNTINDINATANIFLQEFFDEPIFVNLSCFKEDKKKNEKPQINIEVKYKDNDCSLTSLSGGEYARVNLAFTLSLAEIFNTPLLLLDETMSSLDEDIADVVFLVIKKHFKNIPVVSILHQVKTEADFDQVIKL